MKEVRRYFLDFLVIIIGILAAFWVEQKGEDYQNKQKEAEYLSLLKEDLRSDSANLSFLIDYYNQRNEARTILIENLHKSIDLSEDSLSNLVNRTMGYRPFQPSTETFQSIEAGGDLYVLSNDLIKLEYFKLIRMYETSYRYSVESFLPMIYDYGLVRLPYFMDLPAGRVDNKKNLYDKDEIDYFDIARIGTQTHIRRLNENYLKCLEVLELVRGETSSGE